MIIPETASYSEDNLLLPVEQNFGGSTKWQANVTRRVRQDQGTLGTIEPRNPFYDSYSDYAEYIRLVAKDYSVVPEFRMSNHVEKFPQAGNISGSDFGVFEVSGGLEGTSSSNKTGYYKIYSNSEFLKHFELVRNDHSVFVDPSAIVLRC